MEPYQIVYDTLNRLGIAYETVEHPPVMTVAEADRHITDRDGVRTKTLLLQSRKGAAHYLVIMDGARRLHIKKLEQLLGAKGLHFCSPETLLAKLGLTPGSVSLFGLINNTERDVKVCLDDGMLHENRISFHPNDNTKTVFIAMADMYAFLAALGYPYTVLSLSDTDCLAPQQP